MRLLVAFVLTTICTGALVALLIYSDTHSAISSEHLVSHTQEVLLELSDVSQQLDRIDLDAQLYAATGNEAMLRGAQGAAVVLNTLLLRVAALLANNPVQEPRVRELIGAAALLTARVDHLTPQSPPVRGAVLNCRQLLMSMQDTELTLLAQRRAEEQRNDLFSLARRIATIGTGTLLILILFGFLTRDALRRERFEEKLSETNARLRSSVQRLEDQAWQSRLLISARDEVALCLEVQQAEEATVRYLAQLLPGTAGILCVINNSRQTLESVGTWGQPQGVLSDTFGPESCCALRSGRVRWRRPERSEVHCGHFSGKPPERYICFPLVAHGETLGIMYIECPTADIATATEARESTLASIGEMAAMAIAGLHLRQKLESQSIRDGMTGLFNRSFMEVALERELHRAGRREKELAVLMIDIDNFKQFNDTFGHQAGDVVLRQVADALRVGVRGEDIVCRYGGEEFVVILPEVATEVARERAELLRRTVAELALRYHGQPLRQVTISIGLAMSPQNSEVAEDLLRCADRAMYAAKHRGRNRVVQADSSILA